MIQAVCARYLKVDFISLEGENWRETSKIGELIKRFCPKTKLLMVNKKKSS